MPVLVSINNGEQQFGYDVSEENSITVWAVNDTDHDWKVEIDFESGTDGFTVEAQGGFGGVVSELGWDVSVVDGEMILVYSGIRTGPA